MIPYTYVEHNMIKDNKKLKDTIRREMRSFDKVCPNN